MQPVLTLLITLTETYSVRGKQEEAAMLLFTGEAQGECFHGTILPGAVDTQHQVGDEPRSLSARYMLEGRDADGSPCRLFVENSALEGDPHTHPRFVSDSPRLRFLEEGCFYGVLGMQGDQLRIEFYEEG